MVFAWAARTIDGWLVLVRLIRRGWRSLPGDAMGLLVMRACGIRGPTRRVRLEGTSALLVEDPRAARYLDRQWMRVHAQTLGRYVFARERLSEATVAHELEHVRQWRRFGPVYLPLYFVSSTAALLRGRRPYWDNRFEEDARKRELKS